jgi:hypothetical protein
MAGPNSLHVLIGGVSLALPIEHPTLLIDAECDNLKYARQRLGAAHMHPETTFQQTALSASSPAEVIWFHFNDARLNGVVPIEQWQPFYPNLQLIDQHSMAAQTLAQVLRDWPPANRDESTIDITIAQGDPLQVLSGAGEWLHRLRRIQLQGPRSQEIWWERCNDWLQPRGFRPDPNEPLCWFLDPLALQLFQKHEEIQALHLAHQQAIQEYETREDKIMAAINHVFPYTAYKEKRPDLADFSDEKLVEHFIASGIHEDVNLQFSAVDSELRNLRSHVSEQATRLEMLTEKSRLFAQQLDLLKELVSRFMKVA